MEPQTSRKDYKNHQYSGPRKSLKRSRGQMKRYHGENITRRAAVWCKKTKPNDNNDVPSSSIVNKTTKTYTGSKKKYQTEANFTQTEQHRTEKEPISKALDINWLLIDPTVKSHELTIEYAPDSLGSLSGNRFVDLSHVLQWAFKLERHRSQCGGSSIVFVDELKNDFNSLFTFQCSMCKKEFRYSNEKDEKFNKAFVWGALTAGSYYAQAAHITNLMDIPTISAHKFRETEKILGDVWKDHLSEEIQKNGEREKAIAIEKNHLDENGIPYVTVYVDGGWPKRSYGHNYSSPSGMACIIGKETNKCLFTVIKNKYCYHCHIYVTTKTLM